MRLRKMHLILLFLLINTAQPFSFAGSQQTPAELTIGTHELIPFAKKVEKYAASKGARVFIIARLGTPKSELPENIEFTHVGIAVYSEIETRSGALLQGYAIHNLYQNPNDLGVSHLITDYPLDFFMGAAELKAGVIIPTRALQKKLLESLELGLNKQLHNPKYSVIANPYSTKYQNCTEHILDIIFSSIYGTDDLAQIKANQHAYFKSQEIKVPPFKRMLAPMFSQEISTSDHSEEIKTTTFTTIVEFLHDYALAKSSVVIDKFEVRPFGS